MKRIIGLFVLLGACLAVAPQVKADEVVVVRHHRHHRHHHRRHYDRGYYR